MLRIDESSKTLVAPQAGAFVTESAPDGHELLQLVTSSWEAFTGEIGQPRLRLIKLSPAEGIDALAYDEATSRVVVVQVEHEVGEAAVTRALVAAATVAGWDGGTLAQVHSALEGVVPGDSPRVMIVAGSYGASALTLVDWLSRRHGIEATCFALTAFRFGSERLLSARREYPPRDALPSDPAAEVERLLGELGEATLAQSAPPPGL